MSQPAAPHITCAADQTRIDIDTSTVAPLVRRAMQEHRTQWNDMKPGGDGGARLKSVSRETEVIAWPLMRPSRVLTDVFADLRCE